nr:fibroin light chain [Yponomeuta cagnagella]
MLPLVLVLLVAQSALSAPSVSVNQVAYNQAEGPRDNGNLINSYVTDAVFGLLDGAEQNIYMLTNQQIVNDMANSGDPTTQALALGQAINLVGEAVGSAGDACAYANLANAYASGNAGAVSQALSGYVNRLNANINAVARLAVDPSAAGSIVGSSGGCAGGGRSYQFEQVWDSVLANANAYTIGLLNEQYCMARRLYASYNPQNNNVAAALSASAIPQVRQILSSAAGPLANLMRVVASGGDPAQAAASAQQAVAQAAA